MIAQSAYSIAHVNALSEKYQKDPSLLERALFAFGLLEAIARVGMPFVFKGWTALMLILEADSPRFAHWANPLQKT